MTMPRTRFDVYRRVLAQQPDSSVTLVTVGFLTNLRNLLQSEPDALSPLAREATGGPKSKALGGYGRRFSQREGKPMW